MIAMSQSIRRKLSLLDLAHEPQNVSKACRARLADAWPQRIGTSLRLKGVEVSSSAVRGVLLRHDLETRLKRLLRLERHSVGFRCRHVESSKHGELLNQDTFYWGTLKGVGKGLNGLDSISTRA